MAKVTVLTFDQNMTQVGSTVVDVPDEIANVDVLQTKAARAVAGNLAFLALAAPTNAQLAAQLQALTRQVTALIRLETGATADVSGT